MTKNCFLIFSALLIFNAAGGQNLTVWPGDANNSGRVSNLDFLQMGLGYNFFGPVRSNPTPAWVGQTVAPWNYQFADGLNMAFADCNGDGLINYTYDAFPIYVHYGKTHGTVQPDVFQTGLVGVDPPLFLDSANLPPQIHPGTHVKLPIVLGSAGLPISDLYGLAFSISFDSSAVSLSNVVVDLSEISWANDDFDRVFMNFPASSQKFDIGWTRTDHNERAGAGRIGELEFIVIGDVIAGYQLLNIGISDIKMIDKFGNETTVAGDTIQIMVLPPSTSDNDDLENASPLKIFPNPASDGLHILASEAIENVRILNALGQVVLNFEPNLPDVFLSVSDLPRGFYLLEIRTKSGSIIRKISVGQ